MRLIPLATVLCLIFVAGCPTQSQNPPPSPSERGNLPTEASADAATTSGQTVELSATASPSDGGGDVRYAWLQTGGPGVSLENADQKTARFAAPSLAVEQTLTFLVTTSDARGDAGRAEVSVVVAADPNYDPGAGGSGGSGGGSGSAGGSARARADAGDDRHVHPGDTVQLDGSASRGSDLNFLWNQAEGPAVQLSDPRDPRPSFTAPAFDSGGDNTLRFSLAVTDARNRTSTDSVTVTVVDPSMMLFPRVKLETTFGDIVVELNSDKAPITTENFLRYVDENKYDATIFHRVIQGFVVQGGGYFAGLVPISTHEPIVNEADNGLSNLRATIAMARLSDADTATSQFYINLVDNTALDHTDTQPGYTVFGTVVEGMDVVDRIGQVETHSVSGFNDVPVQDVLLRRAVRVE